MTREATCRILDLVESGALSAANALRAALWYMSEADVADLEHSEGWAPEPDDDPADDDPADDDPADDPFAPVVVETIDGRFAVLVAGFQAGGNIDRSGAGDRTFATAADADAWIAAGRPEGEA